MGRTVAFGFDDLGRPTSASNYATGITYAAHGAIRQLTLGNNLIEKVSFNSQLQPELYQLGTSANPGSVWQLQNVYSVTANNGNINQQNQTMPMAGWTAGVSTVYQYDGLGRLKLASEKPSNVASPVCPDAASHWCQQFGYDERGNRLVTAKSNTGQPLNEPASFNASNRISSAGFQYDNNNAADGRGNITKDNVVAKYVYDGENRQTWACSVDPCPATPNAMNTRYVYDGEGRRVQRIDGNGATDFVYDAVGQLVATYGGALPEGGTAYLTSDHLGSTRVVTTGAVFPIARRDYYPFGEEILASAGNERTGEYGYDSGPLKFTGKERDAETGLDYFGARYYSGVQGRFTSADVPLLDQHPEDPQSWNLYGYVRNNPLIFTDPTGNDCVYVNGSGTDVGSVDSGINSTQCGKTGGYWVDGAVTNAQFAHGSLILTGTTDGTNRTSTSYGLGPDPGLLALQQAGQMAGPATDPRFIAGFYGASAVAGLGIATLSGGGLTTLTIPVATLPPLVSNPTLQSIVNKLFQATDKLPGGTAGAVRYERLTGDLMSPSGHSGKAQEVIVAVTNLLKSGKLSYNDQIVCRQIIQDLSDALKTQPRR